MTNARDMSDSGSHSDLTTESTASELRKTGISVIGDVRWGTHFCYFYETKQDLLETLVLYFKAGLENKELCLWVVSPPLTAEEVKRALAKAISDLDRRLAEGNLEIRAHDEWYLQNGGYDPRRVLQSWREKLNQALANGYAGLRASGDTGWIQKDDWMVFREYEKELDALVADQRRLILCTYPLNTSPGDRIFDVARVHQMAVARRNGSWEMVETPELKQAKAEIKRVNDELERKVEERTRELATTNQSLRSEIAERRLAEGAVKQAEDRIRLVIDTIPTMAWSLRSDGVLDFLNQRWLEYTGLSLKEAIEEPTCTVHPKDLPRVMEKWLVVKASNEAYEDEMRLRRADGKYRWFLIRIAPLLDKQGNLLKRYGVAIDIEDRKQAELALRESEERLREFAENIDDVVWLSDPQHKEILYISPAFERIWGRTCASLRASPRSWTEALHPDDRERILELRGDEHLHEMPDMTYRIVRPDGSIRWIHSREFPVKDADGKIVRVAGIVEDITERKRVDLALDERLGFETLLAELSAAFANLPATTVDQEIDKWLQNLVEFLDLDRAIFDQVGEDGITLSRSYSHTVRGIDTLPLDVANDQTPWITEQLLQGNTIKWSRIPDDIPEQASTEKEFAGRIGAKSVLSIPVCIGGAVICAISFTSMRIYRKWPDEMVARLRLVGEIFANAIARKRAEEALFQRQAELNEAQRLASIGSWKWDILADGLTYSDELRRIYGFEGEDPASPGRAFSEAIHPADRPRRNAAVEAALKGGPPYNVEFRMIRPDKSVRFVHSRGRVIYDETGKPVRMFGMAQDITERKRTEEALRESELRFRQIAENINEVFWVWTGRQNSRLVYVSPAYETIWGHSRESLYSSPQSWREALHPKDKERVLADIANSDLEKPSDVTYRIVRPDQSVRWIRDRVFPVRDPSGALVRFAGIAEDVTKSKEAEEALDRANRRLRILSRGRIQAHEDERRRLSQELHDQIGQLLTAGTMNLQSARKSKNRPAITKKLDKTIAILNQILQKIRQISFDIRPPVLDDLGLAPAMRWMFNDTITRAGLSGEFFADPNLKRGDEESETACYRVGLEAVANVVRHAHAQKVWLELRNDGDALQLLVRDDGIGFDVAAAEKRVGRDRLGLAGMLDRATAVGGQFECKSTPGRGTEVRALFPISSKQDRLKPM